MKWFLWFPSPPWKSLSALSRTLGLWFDRFSPYLSPNGTTKYFLMELNSQKILKQPFLPSIEYLTYTFFLAFKGELECVVAELEDTSTKLAPLKAEHDATKGSSFPPFNFGTKNLFCEKVSDRQRDLKDVESILRELQVTSCPNPFSVHLMDF